MKIYLPGGRGLANNGEFLFVTSPAMKRIRLSWLSRQAERMPYRRTSWKRTDISLC